MSSGVKCSPAVGAATDPSNFDGEIESWLQSDGRLNKTRVVDRNAPDAKLSRLRYRVIAEGERYSLLEVTLLTGRKHQIRAQLSSTGTPIKGDLKYGARRSNPGGGISLLAEKIEFIHPVSKEKIEVQTDPLPEMLPILGK